MKTPKNKKNDENLQFIYDALSSTINGVIITDLNGCIKYANPAFLRMFEYSHDDDVIGDYADELFAKKEINSLSDVEERIQNNAGVSEEFLVHRSDASTFWVEVSSSVITDATGSFTGRIASFSDITRKKDNENANKMLASQLLQSIEQERERIAQDLHDTVAQTVHAAKLNFIAYKKNPTKYTDRFQVGLEFLDRISQELREVCDDLYPYILKDHGLESTIYWYIKNFLSFQNIKCTPNINLSQKIARDVEIHLYRIIKEIFSNIIKHSKADHVDITINNDTSTIFLEITDNGIGFDYDHISKTTQGFGLANIKNRVMEINGKLTIESEIAKGTNITIRIGFRHG